jgi:chromosomal replication initiation ATPase DnaA
VLLTRTHEGAIVDIQPTNQEDRQEILATTAAEFSDATHPEEAVPA